MRKIVLVLYCVLISRALAFGQEKSEFLTLDGYVSSLQSVMFDSLSGPFLNDNLIHNRLNLKGYINKNITFAAEFRNRLFTGDLIRTVPSYAEMIGSDPGWVDLSFNILSEESFLFNTTIDRLWADFNYGKIEVRAGRQRINWSQALVWNPNDVFNAYSFFDFDYAEKPGSDAIRIQYYPGSSSAVELAVKSDNKNNITAAALYRFNKWNYDIQFLAGYVGSEDLMAGAGWSGAFGSLSFRGELSWFQPVRNLNHSGPTGIFTAGLDRSFKNNAMAQMQLMYCNNPVSPGSFNTFYYGTLSAKELAFSKFSAFALFSYPVTPLFNATLAGMWFPDLNGYYAGPSLDYSIAENVDLSLYWQHFKSKTGLGGETINLGFLRVKVSF